MANPVTRRSQPMRRPRAAASAARQRMIRSVQGARSFLLSLVDQLDLPGPPGLVEPWLERPVETQADVPSLAGDGLDPVGLLSDWRLGTEVDVGRRVGVDGDVRLLATDARELLVGLQHRARLRVVHEDRPEVLRRDRSRQVQPVALRAVEVLTGRIAERDRVL